jgi:hypothetical protein
MNRRNIQWLLSLSYVIVSLYAIISVHFVLSHIGTITLANRVITRTVTDYSQGVKTVYYHNTPGNFLLVLLFFIAAILAIVSAYIFFKLSVKALSLKKDEVLQAGRGSVSMYEMMKAFFLMPLLGIPSLILGNYHFGFKAPFFVLEFLELNNVPEWLIGLTIRIFHLIQLFLIIGIFSYLFHKASLLRPRLELIFKSTQSADGHIAECPNCGSPYKLSDYRSDMQHIFCANCKKEIPRA